MSAHMSTDMSTHNSTHTSIHMSTYMSTHTSTHMSIRTAIHMSIHTTKQMLYTVWYEPSDADGQADALDADATEAAAEEGLGGGNLV